MTTRTGTCPPGIRGLRVRRQEAGLGVREAGRKWGFDASHLIRVETGRTVPSVETLYRIACGLGIDELVAALRPYVGISETTNAFAFGEEQAPAVLKTPGGPDGL